jgi:hypothetical protein
MSLTVLDVLKKLPLRNFEKIGPAISLSDVYQSLKSLGLDNTDIINFKLKELESKNLIKLHYMDASFDDSMFYALNIL